MNRERNYNIDLLRILCALVVFCFHAHIHMGVNFSFLNLFIKQGAVFMSPFFMLSGYGLFLQYENYDWMSNATLFKFYAKRLIAIYPLYLIIHIIYMLLFNRLSIIESIALQPIELFGMQSFLNGISSVLHNGGTWYISCLLFCYILFPLFEVLIRNVCSWGIITIGGIIYIIIAIVPMYEILFKVSGIYTNPFIRVLEFLMGMLIVKLVNSRGKNVKYGLWGVCLVSIFYVCVVSRLSGYEIFDNQYVRYNFVTIPTFCVIFFCVSLSENKFIKNISKSKVVAHMARLAYAFYLGQFFCFKIAKVLSGEYDFDKSSILSVVIAFITCYIIAEALHNLVEKPCKNFLNSKLFEKTVEIGNK